MVSCCSWERFLRPPRTATSKAAASPISRATKCGSQRRSSALSSTRLRRHATHRHGPSALGLSCAIFRSGGFWRGPENKMLNILHHLINGQAVGGDAGGESLNPSDLDDVVARYPKAGTAEVNQAVEAARAAFPAWSNASPEVRSDVLDKAGSIIMSRAKELGTLLS